MIDDEEKGSFDKERATTETSDKDLPTKTFQRRPSDEDLPTKTFPRRLREKTTTKMTKEKAGRQTKRFIDDHDNDDAPHAKTTTAMTENNKKKKNDANKYTLGMYVTMYRTKRFSGKDRKGVGRAKCNRIMGGRLLF